MTFVHTDIGTRGLGSTRTFVHTDIGTKQFLLNFQGKVVYMELIFMDLLQCMSRNILVV